MPSVDHTARQLYSPWRIWACEKKLSLINAVKASATTQIALKSAPKPSARNIPSKETLPPPAETATIAAKAVIAPTTVSHCRKARALGKNMSAHSRPMAVTKSVSSGSRAGSSFSNGRAERGATDMAVMIAPMVLPLCRKARCPPAVWAKRWPVAGAQTFIACARAGATSCRPARNAV